MGVDPSTSTGVVILEGTQVLVSEAIRFNETDGYTRLHLIAARFAQLVDIFQPEVIAIEGFAYGNRFTLVLMVQVGTLLRSKLYQRDRMWWDVPPTSLKKWVTGSGAADKKVMKRAVEARWGFTAKTSDEVDAFALAKWGQEVLEGRNPQRSVKP